MAKVKVKNIYMRERVQAKGNEIILAGEVLDGMYSQGKTKQEFKDECNINNILKNYAKTGILKGNSKKPVYGDFSQVKDFHSAQLALFNAHDEFMKLDSSLRKKFQNDPAKLLDFIADQKNYKEAYELGLLDEARAKIYLESLKPKNDDNLNDDVKKA